MNAPLKRTKPMRRKSRKKIAYEASPEGQEDAAYLRAVRALPCCICVAYGEAQNSATTAHHPIMDRFSGRKVPDRMAIPLCDGHHQGNFDTSKVSVHREPKAWRAAYGPDHEWIAVTQDEIGRNF